MTGTAVCLTAPCQTNQKPIRLPSMCAQSGFSTDIWTEGIPIGGRKFLDMKYADDTTHLAETEEELIELIAKIRKSGREHDNV